MRLHNIDDSKMFCWHCSEASLVCLGLGDMLLVHVCEALQPWCAVTAADNRIMQWGFSCCIIVIFISVMRSYVVSLDPASCVYA